MKRTRLRNTGLALFGLVSLLIYVLACTSFSPDDKKVLYTALDPGSGLVGISVYDIETGRSEPLFVPALVESGAETAQPALVRAQWIHGGRDVLIGWSMSKQIEESMQVAVVPFGRKGVVRQFALGTKESGTRLLMPLAVAGSYLCYTDETNRLARLNLDTGEIAYNDGWDNDCFVLPSRSGKTLLYGRSNEMGVLNPETFERTRKFEGDLGSGHDDKQLVLSMEEGQFGYLSGKGQMLTLWESGKAKKEVSLQAVVKDNEKLGLLAYSPAQKKLYAPFIETLNDKQGSVLGFLEIPMDGSSATRTVLLQTKAVFDEEDVSFYFQPSISNDGKTLAVATTYLSHREGFDPKDCALFFVDLSSPKRTIKRVPIPPGPKNLLSHM